MMVQRCIQGIQTRHKWINLKYATTYHEKTAEIHATQNRIFHLRNSQKNAQKFPLFLQSCQQCRGRALQIKKYRIYIRTVSSECLFSALLNWIKLVYCCLGRLRCPQLPGRLFRPSDKSKKLSYHFLLHFPIGMGSYDHHAKYQGVFP